MRESGCSQAIVIGGSAGSIPVLNTIITSLPAIFEIPIIICMHRMKNVSDGVKEVLSRNAQNVVHEPDDKDPILPGHIYLAPSNYHMLISSDYSFCLSTDVLVNYSRPSIDLTFQSASNVYKNGLTGILLTGANKDGAGGMLHVKNNGGVTIVQDPEECMAPCMPLSAMALMCVDHVLSCKQITTFLQRMSNHRNK